MTGLEVAAATYLFTWAKQRGKVAGQRVGDEVDNAVRLAMERLYALVVGKLGSGDRRLGRLEREAGERDQPTDKALAAVAEDLKSEAEEDPDFAAALHQLVADLQTAQSKAGNGNEGGGAVSGNTFHGPTAVQTGNHNQQTNTFGK